MAEIEIEINGRVQGVNFRNMCKNFCDKYGMSGYIMNKGNGGVFINAQAEREDLERLLLWIQNNPGFIMVESLSYRWKKPSISYKEFSIVKERSYLIDKARSVVNLGKFFVGKKNKIRIPEHICIIPDGNRRWAKEK